MNSMNGGLLYADKPNGRARLSRALLTLAIPPLACGFVIGLEAAGESVRASRTEEIAPDAADATVQA